LNRIILASASSRRKILLKGLIKNFGLKFIVKPANIEEYIQNHKNQYSQLVKALAKEKALTVSKKNKGLIIGADTIVVLKNVVYGKPVDKNDAVRMLKKLSGNWHNVYTGIYIFDTGREGFDFSDYERTKVKFRNLDDKEIKFYVNSGAPDDKAGAYGIQDDLGCTFVEKIIGDYFNVVGLPLVKTYMGLKKFIKLVQ